MICTQNSFFGLAWVPEARYRREPFKVSWTLSTRMQITPLAKINRGNSFGWKPVIWERNCGNFLINDGSADSNDSTLLTSKFFPSKLHPESILHTQKSTRLTCPARLGSKTTKEAVTRIPTACSGCSRAYRKWWRNSQQQDETLSPNLSSWCRVAPTNGIECFQVGLIGNVSAVDKSPGMSNLSLALVNKGQKDLKWGEKKW